MENKHAPATHTLILWDLFIRIHHWLLVLLVAGQFLTADVLGRWSMPWHIYGGYAIAALVVLRILWGFAGPPSARFSHFVKPPRQVLSYLRDLRNGHRHEWIGHNPLGGLGVVGLLVLLLVQFFTGYGAIYAFHHGLFHIGRLAMESHEALSNLLAGLIMLHVAAVAWHHFRLREPLLHAMIHGHRRVSSERAQSDEHQSVGGPPGQRLKSKPRV